MPSFGSLADGSTIITEQDPKHCYYNQNEFIFSNANFFYGELLFSYYLYIMIVRITDQGSHKYRAQVQILSANQLPTQMMGCLKDKYIAFIFFYSNFIESF